MTLPREAWPRLKEAFEGARALTSDARAEYLAEVCDGDEALRHEVELLLAHDDQAASFLETPAMPLDDRPVRAVAKSLEGQCIGPYQVSALIGTGGMGEVYSARDTNLNRFVAIKVLRPALANDPDRLARFSREAQLLASLNHPHVAQIHGFENAAGLHALVMELVEGPTLADRIAEHGARGDGARRGLEMIEALPIARQIADALAAAHEQGIIHRDLRLWRGLAALGTLTALGLVGWTVWSNPVPGQTSRFAAPLPKAQPSMATCRSPPTGANSSSRTRRRESCFTRGRLSPKTANTSSTSAPGHRTSRAFTPVL